MPRELRPELETLIESGHCNWHTAIDIVLTGGTPQYLSTGEIHVDRFGIDRQYLAKLRPDVAPLTMSVDEEIDEISFKVANVNMEFGREFTGAVRRFDGARATRGVIFIDRDLDFDDNQHILDQNFPGELQASEVSDESVAFSLVSDIDSVIVSGRTIASEFQWREPISTTPLRDPSDILPPVLPGGPGRDPYDIGGHRWTRFGDPLLPMLPE